MSRTFFSLRRRRGFSPRHPAPTTIEDAGLVSGPGVGFALFHVSSCIFISSDDADRFLKLASTAVVRCQSGRRRRAYALASVRRSNCTCRFPAYSFHEDTRGREYEPSEGIRALRFTKPNSSYSFTRGN